MDDYYQILALNNSATEAEIRRAYRILARRYHPDVNPGEGSKERFQQISSAYETLKDPVKRRQYDVELERNRWRQQRPQFQSYRRQQEQAAAAQRYYRAQKADYEKIRQYQEQTRSRPPEPPLLSKLPQQLLTFKQRLGERLSRWRESASATKVAKVSIIEVSVSMPEVISGVRKTVEIEEPNGLRKIKVRIPPGVRTGSIVRLRSSSLPNEELVLVVRVAKHPWLSIENHGLVLQLPITVKEAIAGASIMVPTFGEPLLLKIPPNTQSGTDFRLKGRGIPGKEENGDLIGRVLIQVPESVHAVGIKEKAAELDLYYEQEVRRHLPQSLSEA